MWSTLRYGARLLSLFWSLLGHRKRSFVGMVGLGLLGAALDSLGIALVVPFLATLQGQPTTLTSELLAGFTQEHTNPLLMIAVAVGAVFLIKNAVVVTRIRWSLKVLYELWHGWVATIFTSIVYAPAERTEKEKPGVLLAVTLNHSSESINALRHVLDLTVSGLTLCAIYAVLLLLSWPATLAASVLMAAFGLAVVRPLSRKAHRAGSRFVRAQKAASVTLLEALGGFRYVKAFRRETAFENRMAASVGELERSFVDAAWAGTLIHPLVETVVIGFFVAAVWVLTLGGAPAVANALPLLGAFAAAAFRLFPVVSSLGAYWVGFISKESSARSLRESLEPREPEPTGAAPFRALGQSVELERVSFAYEGRPPALSGVTMRFERGKRTALVGESGAGKSTIVGLLLGFLRPQTGSVRVDGRPLSELRLDAWRAALGYVGQDGFTFSATLAENVTLGRIPEDDPRILEVLEVVGLGELAATLPRGLRTELGERGSQLSGGQRQRVALARALLLKPSLLLLDEATSALDNESAAATLERTSTFASGSTVVSVGHRLSHTRGYDTIYVLRDGKVVEHGAHDELMLRRGYYARLFAAESRRQAKPAPEEATLHGASNETP